jgi:hypothetical protein
LGAPGRVDDLVAVAEVSRELTLGHHKPLAFVLDQDLPVGLEESLRGTLSEELGPVLGAFGRRRARGFADPTLGGSGRLRGGHQDVEALVVVDRVVLPRADHHGILLAVAGVYLVGAGSAVEDVFAAAAVDKVASVAAADLIVAALAVEGVFAVLA